MSIWTRISDIIGRKKTLITADIIFLAFSLGCAVSQTMNDLYEFGGPISFPSWDHTLTHLQDHLSSIPRCRWSGSIHSHHTLHIRDSAKNQTPNIWWDASNDHLSCLINRANCWGCASTKLGVAMGFLHQVSSLPEAPLETC